MAVLTKTKYESDLGSIHPISVTGDRFLVVGTPPTGSVDSSIKAKISKSNKEYGLRPRGVMLEKVFGAEPDTFKKYTFLPVLTAAEWASATFAIGGTITIGGEVWIISSKIPEDY